MIFQFYHEVQIYWVEDIREPGENHWRDILREQDSDFISTDCVGICKSNYHTTTETTIFMYTVV